MNSAAGQKQKTARTAAKNKEWIYVWFSFAMAYAWFNVLFYNGAHNPISPLMPFAEALGVDPEYYLAAIYAPLAVTVIACFFLMKDENLSKYRPLWAVIHFALFASAAILPFLKNVYVFYAVVAISGALCGLIIYRIFYSLFFFIPAIGWVKMFVLTFVCLRASIHLFSLASPGADTYVMYGVSMAMLAAGIFLSLKFKGNVLEVRKRMPETKFKVKPLIPYMLLMGGLQACLAAYKALVLPYLIQDFSGALLDTLSSVVTLTLMWFWGGKLKKERYLQLFFILMLLAFASYQLFGGNGRNIVETFMQPAYLCWDIFFYSLIVGLFYNYGKRHMQLRVVLLVLFLAIVLGQTVLNYVFQNYVPGGTHYFGFIYVAVFALFLMIPYVTKRANLAEIMEGSLAPHVARGDSLLEPAGGGSEADASVKAEALAELLPEQEKLTKREREVLEQIVQGQDTDVIAYILDISQNTVRSHMKNICGKFGVYSKEELLGLAGGAEQKIVLTQREREVAKLLLSGNDNNAIARTMYISIATVKSHVYNICRKCGVSTRAELVEYMTAKMPIEKVK